MGKKLTLITSNPVVTPKPPRPLGKHGLAVWQGLHREFIIEDGGTLEVLCQGCAAIDRAESCAEAIARDGPVVMVRGSPREHPLLRCELSARALAIRTLSRLGLTFEQVKPIGRPPGYA
jgi:hypothetical protein